MTRLPLSTEIRLCVAVCALGWVFKILPLAYKIKFCVCMDPFWAYMKELDKGDMQ